MIAMVWNARGLGGRRAFLNLKRLVTDNKPCFMFISESKISSNVARRWANLLFFTGCISVDPRGRSGGLILFWNETVYVSLRSFTCGHIDCSILGSNLSWRFTGFYGNPAQHLRKFSWGLLRRLARLASYPDEPWLIGGDFNEIKGLTEKKGGGSRSFSQITAFVEVLDELGMRDLPSSGPKFTWLNKRTGRGRIMEKLDRFVANEDWRERFPAASVTNGGFYGSDHRAIKVQLLDRCSKTRESAPTRFLFENKWLLEDGYNEMVRQVWSHGSVTVSLPERLKDCGQKIRAWAHAHSDSIPKRIKQISRRLEERLCSEQIDELSEETRKLELELEKLHSQEEMHWHQRSRNNWLSLGDRNTSFFHKCASGRRARNRI
ncbi:hypothetical protein ACS0TY_031475 [Phlomoides rotata]